MKNRKYFVVYVADIANKETNCKEKDYIENIIVEANDVGKKYTEDFIDTIIKSITEFHNGLRANIRIINIVKLKE